MERTRLLQTGIITALQSKEFRPLSRSRARMFSQGTKIHNHILDFFFFFLTQPGFGRNKPASLSRV